ncbi:ABC transporter substrate-binding protein [Neptuniibacter sp. CAU 1671]|uniref:transporter substrate-binding domain-containing diguanylate cyclase n=1 Tax=Neptuniibacter sp. CAU 1671 TaxID=3032593 RepID=UPI0023DA1232|nr:ABC transporter substrate-binding protein [Neptuniibacter sp. CAU 1671]MDF2182370.1 ABC transporter substrate-binding protein [Neptuniibacter sp. CAU 1671]
MNGHGRDKLGYLSLIFVVVVCIIPFNPLSAAEETVRLQLLWKHQFQFAGYYIAKEKGLYTEAGIDVQFLELPPGQDPADIVTRGDAEFGVGRSSLVLQRARGAPVVAMLAAFQYSPLMLMTRADSDIKSPADLAGKRVEITLEAQQGSEIIAMLLKYGLTIDQIVLVPHSFSIEKLINHQSDAVASYVSNEPYAMSLRGFDVNQIHPQAHGFPMYSDILFTSEKLARTRPDLVQRFRTASVQGWLYAFDNIDETVALILNKYNPQGRTADALKYEAESLKHLAFDEQGLFGTIKPERFQSMANVYRITDQLAGDIDLSGFIFCCNINPEQTLPISLKERQWLANLPELTVCTENNWAPFVSVPDKAPEGIIVDYTKAVLDTLGLKYRWRTVEYWNQAHARLLSKNCDLLSGINNRLDSSDRILFSKPYFSMPMVAATRNGEGLQSLSLRQGRVGIMAHHGIGHLIAGRYPGLTLRSIFSVKDGLRQVQNNELDAFIDAEASIADTQRKLHISNLVIDTSIQDSWDLSFAATPNNSYLISLLDRAIGTLEPKVRNDIAERWLPLSYKPVLSSETVERGLLLLGLVLAFFGYRYYIVHKNNRMLQRIVHTDPLTKTQNRYAMQQQLKLHLNLSARNQSPFTLIFLDIDNFKQINDKNGHDFGDKVLIAVCETIKQGLRVTDELGRWGGEEFLVILPNTDLDGGTQVAEKLRLRLKQSTDYPFALPTCSFGVAEWQPGESQENLVQRADNALYQAKYRGKDMVRQALFPIPSMPRPPLSQKKKPY